MTMTLNELLTNATTCPHPKPKGVIHVVDGYQDLAYLSRRHKLDPKNFPAAVNLNVGQRVFYSPVVLCDDCYAKVPSVVREQQEREEKALGRAKAEAVKQASEMADRVELHNTGDTLYVCTDCDGALNESELVDIRYCPHCEENFNAEDGRNCVNCNRPFTSKVGPGCGECCDVNVAPMSDEDMAERLAKAEAENARLNEDN